MFPACAACDWDQLSFVQVFQRHLVQQALGWRKGCLAAPGMMPMLLPAAFMVPLVAQALGYTDSRTKSAAGHETGAMMQNGLGLMQWLIVAAFVLYFVSYAVDVHQCACQDEQDACSVRLPKYIPRSFTSESVRQSFSTSCSHNLSMVAGCTLSAGR